VIPEKHAQTLSTAPVKTRSAKTIKYAVPVLIVIAKKIIYRAACGQNVELIH